ncbi:MAG: Uma2 family endonuclease [Lachnospiraceae bacterium]
MPLPKENTYTTDYIYSLPEGQRAELIDGVIYDMAQPNRLHQELVSELHYKITDYIKKNKGVCKVYPAPFAVFLNADDRNYVEPDISVICDNNKLDDKGCNGAPDWIIEIASPSTKRIDYSIKLFKYRSAGVREYWIVNPRTRIVNVYDFEKEALTDQYCFDDDIQVCIYDDLTINIAELLK